MVQEIAPLVQECLYTFRDLSNDTFSLSTTGIADILWQDELGRFKIWAANIGAHRTGQSSLDSRLRDASLVRAQILRILNGIKQNLDDLDETISDHFTKMQPQPGLQKSEDLEEAEEIFRAIRSSINRLFDISMIIRKPVQGDLFRGALQEFMGNSEDLDLQYVRYKFRGALAPIQDRLAAAITQRRKELKYYERHRQNLGQGIDAQKGEPSDTTSTAPSFVPKSDFEVPDDVSVSDDGSDASSLPESLFTSENHARMPKMPTELKDGKKGECPYCFRIISVKSKRGWVRHVFADLRPYIAHMRESHSESGKWPPSNCALCMKDNFHPSEFARHVGRHLLDLALWILPHDEDDAEATQQEHVSIHSADLSDLDQSSSEDEGLEAGAELRSANIQQSKEMEEDDDDDDNDERLDAKGSSSPNTSAQPLREIDYMDLREDLDIDPTPRSVPPSDSKASEVDAAGIARTGDQSEARGRTSLRLPKRKRRETAVALENDSAADRESAVPTSTIGKPAGSAPHISGYQWDRVSSYRLSKFTLQEYLTALFGNFDFYIQHTRADTWKFWIPRPLTSVEQEELLRARRTHY